MTKKFSFVIAVAPERDAEVLQSLKQLDYDKRNYEVIVKKGKNPSVNRNEGVKDAKGEIICFLDDDARIEKDLLKKAETFFKQHPQVDVVGGPQLTPHDDGTFAQLSGIALSSFLGSYHLRFRYKLGKLMLKGAAPYLTSAICFIKKNSFITTGGFNTLLFPGEDPEFFSRAERLGLIVAYDPGIFIYHQRRSTLTLFMKQIYLYGKVAVRQEKVQSTGFSLLYTLPALFVLYLLFLPFLAYLHIVFLFPLFAYVVLLVISSFVLAVQHRNFLALFLLPFIIFVQHISYGVGVIVGLIHRF